jgi:DNA/RNA-binding domain of Phe-tRNA-synthetase-like protein
MDASELTEDPRPLRGVVAPEVAGEFPELALFSLTLDAVSTRSPREVRQRLKDLSDRFRGAQAVAMRRQPIPWAYRVFYRHIGLDPDTDRPPMEALALDRLLKGHFRSQSLLDDGLTIALMETGVPLWALDADTVRGPLVIRLARSGESLGRASTAPPMPDGGLVIADDEGPVAVLFGALAPGHGVTPKTTRMTLFALQVAGVPEIFIEEAFWEVVEALGTGNRQ